MIKSNTDETTNKLILSWFKICCINKRDENNTSYRVYALHLPSTSIDNLSFCHNDLFITRR